MEKLIRAKRDYHDTVAKAWVVYDAAVDEARKVLDVALIAGENTEASWKKYNDATLPARVVFETAIRAKRLVRDQHVERVAIMKATKENKKEK